MYAFVIDEKDDLIWFDDAEVCSMPVIILGLLSNFLISVVSVRYL